MSDFQALVLSLPARNSTVRMRLWRALKESGCGVLRDGVYLLPSIQANGAFEKFEAEICAHGGFAMQLRVTPTDKRHSDEIQKLFDRSRDYGLLVRNITAIRSSLPRLGSRRGQTAIQRLERAFDKLCAIDFFPGEAKAQATSAISDLKRAYQSMYSRDEPRFSHRALRPADRRRYERRVWATRKSPWVDRLASAWLIKRFIDREAKFVWISRPSERPKKAVGFDYDGAEFTHVKNLVTFEVLLASFGLDDDPALRPIAAAVHFLDVGGIPVADANVLSTMLKGAKEKSRTDDALLVDAVRIFDLLYSAYRPASP